VVRRDADCADRLAVNEEHGPVGPPLDGVGVELPNVQVHPGRGEVLDHPWVPKRVRAHAHGGARGGVHGVAEDLHDTELGTALRPVLQADQPLQSVGEVVCGVGGSWSAEVDGEPVGQLDPRGRRSVHREGTPSGV
jgi:hypothetical protein